MKLVKLTLVVAVFLASGTVRAEDSVDNAVGPRTNLDQYRAGEFKCPRELAEMKRNAVVAAQDDAANTKVNAAN